ncbi:hypothetical protein L4C36_21305 [Photobacterium japonica]|uniref:hypothetical protein n=1 Tax=Photobacterium japonica TaxID=2910235 RepID=UPI003D0C0E2A
MKKTLALSISSVVALLISTSTLADNNQKQLADSILASPTLSCLGTEPFWGIDVKGKALIFSDLGGEQTLFNINFYSSSINHTNRWVMQAINKDAEQPISLALYETGECTDDMSDFRYQHEVIVTMPDHAVYSGCCNRLPLKDGGGQ